MSGNENQNENAAQGADSTATEAAYKLAHVVGVSTPEDRYQSPGGEEHRSDAALAAMGVEPDHGPGRGLVGFTVFLVIVLGFVGVGTIEFFQHFAGKRMQAVSQQHDTRAAEMHAEAQALLTTPAALEGSPGHFRIPISDALAVLDTHPELLAAHPLGVASEMAIPDDALPPPPPPPPVFVPGEIDPATGLVQLAPGIPCVPGVGAVLPPPVTDPATGLLVEPPLLPAYDPATCALIPAAAEGSGAAVEVPTEAPTVH